MLYGVLSLDFMKKVTEQHKKRKNIKKMFVISEKVCNFATDYGCLKESLCGECIRIR